MSKQTDLINVTDAITVSGSNVGIGSSDPRGHLDIAADQNTAKFASPHLALTTTGTTNNTGFTGVSYAVSSLTNYGWTAGALRATSGNNSSFVFTQHNNSSVGIERMRIDGSGKVLVNRTTAYSDGTIGNAAFQVNANTGVFAGLAVIATATTGTAAVGFVNPNGSVGNISLSGTSTSYNTSSDYRLKTDAQPMTGASARVQALNPVNFEWIADGTRVDGFLAHEAQAVVPEAVTGTKDAMGDEEYEVTPAVLDEDGNVVTEAVMGTRSVPDYQGIDQSKLVPLLTAALQEALTKIDDMETRLAALEAV